MNPRTIVADAGLPPLIIYRTDEPIPSVDPYATSDSLYFYRAIHSALTRPARANLLRLRRLETDIFAGRTCPPSSPDRPEVSIPITTSSSFSAFKSAFEYDPGSEEGDDSEGSDISSLFDQHESHQGSECNSAQSDACNCDMIEGKAPNKQRDFDHHLCVPDAEAIPEHALALPVAPWADRATSPRRQSPARPPRSKKRPSTANESTSPARLATHVEDHAPAHTPSRAPRHPALQQQFQGSALLVPAPSQPLQWTGTGPLRRPRTANEADAGSESSNTLAVPCEGRNSSTFRPLSAEEDRRGRSPTPVHLPILSSAHSNLSDPRRPLEPAHATQVADSGGTNLTEQPPRESSDDSDRSVELPDFLVGPGGLHALPFGRGPSFDLRPAMPRSEGPFDIHAPRPDSEEWVVRRPLHYETTKIMALMPAELEIKKKRVLRGWKAIVVEPSLVLSPFRSLSKLGEITPERTLYSIRRRRHNVHLQGQTDWEQCTLCPSVEPSNELNFTSSDRQALKWTGLLGESLSLRSHSTGAILATYTPTTTPPPSAQTKHQGPSAMPYYEKHHSTIGTLRLSPHNQRGRWQRLDLPIVVASLYCFFRIQAAHLASNKTADRIEEKSAAGEESVTGTRIFLGWRRGGASIEAARSPKRQPVLPEDVPAEASPSQHRRRYVALTSKQKPEREVAIVDTVDDFFSPALPLPNTFSSRSTAPQRSQATM